MEEEEKSAGRGVQGRAAGSTQGCSPALGLSLEVTMGSLRRRGTGLRCCRGARHREGPHGEGRVSLGAAHRGRGESGGNRQDPGQCRGPWGVLGVGGSKEGCWGSRGTLWESPVGT